MRKFILVVLISIPIYLTAQNTVPIATPLYIQSTAPSITTGYLWYDTANNVLKVKTPTGWTDLGASSGGGGQTIWGAITGILSSQTDLQGALDNKSNNGHVHDYDSITGLGDQLNAKANASHTHSIGDVTNLENSLPIKLFVTADVSNNTTSYADITGLTVPVVTGRTYAFTCNLTYTSAVTTTAINVSINGPSITALDYSVSVGMAATSIHMSAQTAYDTVLNPGTGGAASRLPITINGTIIPSANGTVAIRYRSEIAASAVTVKRGSFCLVY